MSTTVLVLTKLPGHLPVKTRLHPELGPERSRAIYRWMLRRTLATARCFEAAPTLAYSPPDADPRRALPGIGTCRFLPTLGTNGSSCLEYALCAGYRGEPMIALGGDAPDLPVRWLRALREALGPCDAALVPSGDGGFSALALRRPLAGLAEAFGFGSDDACAALERWLRSRGQRVAVLPAWPDVDTPDDLRALYDRLGESRPMRPTAPPRPSSPLTASAAASGALRPARSAR